MTSPQDREALEQAIKNIREGIRGSTVPLSMQDPSRMRESLETIKELERELGKRPTLAQERETQVDERVRKLREQTEKARIEGRRLGQEMFGEGVLGTAGAIGAPGQFGADRGALQRARGLAEQQAREGLTSDVEQILRERGQQELSSRAQTGMRQLRSLASGAGMRGETRKAREAGLIRDQLRSERDLAESLRLLDVEQRNVGLQAFGALAGQEAQVGLQTDIARNTALSDIAKFNSNTERFNIGLRQTERERRLTTEFANVGLQQATESLGINRTL